MGLTSDEDSPMNAETSNLTPKKKRLQRGGDALKSEKQGHRDQKFRDEWCLKSQYKYWLKPVSNDVFRAKCSMCNKDFRADISVIKNHANGSKHKLMMCNAKPKSQNSLQMFIDKSRVDPLGDKVKDAELLLSSYVAAHDMPFAGMDHLTPVLARCFPDSKIAQALSLKRTKTKCVIKNVIGVHEKENLTKKLQFTKFSILMDESTDISSVKTACIMVRFYDEESCGIVSNFWELCQIFSQHDAQGAEEGATAERLFNVVIQTFQKRNINIENIVGFGSDGCVTMMGKHNSVASRFIILCPNIFIMKCICHSLHLCASEACKQLPRKTEDLARDIHNFMKSSSKSQAQIAQFQKFLDLDVHKILHPSQTRWLSLIAVVERIVEQWDALRLFFDDKWLSEHLRAAEHIHLGLNDCYLKAYFLFLLWILPKFTEMNEYFQSSKVVVIYLHKKMSTAFKDLLLIYMTRDYVCKTELGDINPLEKNHFLPLKQVCK